MATAAERHPGDAEAAGAIAGMAEVYGPARLPTRGQFIHGRSGGKEWRGQCVSVEPGRVIVEVDDEVFVFASPSDIEWD